MVELLVSVIDRGGIGCQLGQIKNQVGDADGSCLKIERRGSL